MKVHLDQFYTKPKVAQQCLSLITDIHDYDTIVEPSAGAGSFSNLINCTAYDLEPLHPDIIKQNWFDVKEIKGEKILVMGNPPFGKRSKIAKDFIKHAISLGAETIAFILPDTFNKLHNQPLSLFSNDWRLIEVYKLPDSSFYVEAYGDYHVPCTFFIWTKSVGLKNLRKVKYQNSTNFIFLSRGSSDATFCVNGNNGAIKNIDEVSNSKAEHYIKNTKARYSDLELKNIFISLNFDFHSSVNGGNAWISQQDILQAYYKYHSKIRQKIKV